MSLANQGRLERPITSSRLLELLKELIGGSSVAAVSKASVSNNAPSSKLSASSKESQVPSRVSVGTPSSTKDTIQ